jgi:hypothetical protein
MHTLLRWRVVTWAHGRPLGRPRAIDIEGALRIAPSRRRWIYGCAREQARREQAIRQMPLADEQNWPTGHASAIEHAVRLAPQSWPLVLAESEDRVLVADTLIALAKTRSASTFSAYVASSGDHAPVKLVVHAVNSSSQFSEMLDTFQSIEARIGHDRLLQAVIALAHARARSHSWRYTRLFPRIVRTRIERRLGRAIDRAESGRSLQFTLNRMHAVHEHGALDHALYRVLYRRSRSLRWRLTAPLRNALASRRFQRMRRTLRERVRPQLRAHTRRAHKLREGMRLMLTG